MRGPPSLSIVIVTYNSTKALRALLPSLDPDAEVIVVDNASADDIAAVLAATSVKLIRNGDNLGYGTACNRGAAAATGDLVMFLNPDIAVTRTTFAELTAAAGRYPDAAVFVPRIEADGGRPLVRDHNFIERVRLPEGWIRGKEAPAGDCCIHSIHGAAFMARRETFLAAGGFDEKIFLYFEDDDLACRLVTKKAPIVYVAAALAVHGEQKSSEASSRRSLAMGFHKKRSEIYLRRKYGLPYSAGYDLSRHIASLAFYLATLRFGRFVGALGRTRGILSMRPESHAPVAES